ncbi:hypothetical protein MTO96_027432 [Rhipicephalus appendiculatus]
MKEQVITVGDNAAPPQDGIARKSKADMSIKVDGPPRPMASASKDEGNSVEQHQQLLYVQDTHDRHSLRKAAAPHAYFARLRRPGYGRDGNRCEGRREESSTGSKSKTVKRKEKKATRKNASLPHFFLSRHRESEGGDDASSVRSESSGTTDGLRLSVIMAKLGILPSRRFFSSFTTTTDKGGSSRETVVPSRHGAGDRGCHFGADVNRASPQRAVIGAGVSSSVVLPRVWPEPSTSFSVVENSDMESIIVDDSCADALSLERNVP